MDKREDIVFSDFFEYDESSPTCLVWKKDRYRRNYETMPFVMKGQVAGTATAWEYYNVYLWDKPYKTHRIIMDILGFANYFGKHMVDHIDGNKANNKIENLRIVTRQQNCQNRRKSKNNVTGFSGVTWKEAPRVKGSATFAVASWKTSNGQRNKYFSVSKYGLLPAFKLAVEYRIKMINKLNEEGSAYTERHGK